jgi:hypothetical protein
LYLILVQLKAKFILSTSIGTGETGGISLIFIVPEVFTFNCQPRVARNLGITGTTRASAPRCFDIHFFFWEVLSIDPLHGSPRIMLGSHWASLKHA